MSTRRRGEDLENALYAAAWQELSESGYSGITFEAVATRAQTSRAVLYRRWADKGELVRDTIAHHFKLFAHHIPDTGSFREDLIGLLEQSNATREHMLTGIRVHLSGYYEATGQSPAELRKHVLGDGPDVLEVVYDRAIERGEVDPDKATRMVRKAPFAVLRGEIMSTRERVPRSTLEEIVDTLVLPLVTPAHRTVPENAV